MTKREWITEQRRDLLADLDLETLRALEAGLVATGDGVDWQLEAVNIEIAARVAAGLEDSINRKRTGDELIADYRRNKAGADWPHDMNRQRR